ncbi:MAG: prepilin peptidase [Candidatus Moraniibacteriota bacterium]
MLIIFFILGLIIGSFLNVVVYRINLAETLMGRSYCPKCKKQIRWYDNIPVISFILLRFKCRDCKTKISWIYPIVELGTGIVFALLSLKFFVLTDTETWFITFYYLTVVSALIVILVYDFLYMEIPSIILWITVILAVFCNLLIDLEWSTFDGNIFNSLTFSGLIGSFVAFIFFFLLSFFSKEKWMGMGDVYLVILLGLILGWPEILLGLFLAFAIGAIYGIILIIIKQKKMSSQVPFAPFLVLGTIVTIFYYNSIANWYLSLF